MHFEMTSIKITSKDSQLYIIVIYRSPSGNDNIFFRQFESLLNELNSKKRQFVMLGDFNIDVLNSENQITRRLSDTLNSFGLKWSVNSPTRVSATSGTAIDNVITNMTNVCVTVIKTAISDHYAQEAVIGDYLPDKEPPRLNVGRNLCPNNISLLRRRLSNEKWDFSRWSTVEDKFKHFMDTFLYHLNQICPVKSTKSRCKKKRIPG